MMFTGLGSTETGPAALFPGKDLQRAGEVGLPAPGVELKLVPSGGKLEARLRSPSITPGYWRQPESDARRVRRRRLLRIGDALRFVDPDRRRRGDSCSTAASSEDFKLSTGTWVSVGPLRAKIPEPLRALRAGCGDRRPRSRLRHRADLSRRGRCRVSPPRLLRSRDPACARSFRALLKELAAEATGSSNRIARAMLMDRAAVHRRPRDHRQGIDQSGRDAANRAALVDESIFAASFAARHLYQERKGVSERFRIWSPSIRTCISNRKHRQRRRRSRPQIFRRQRRVLQPQGTGRILPLAQDRLRGVFGG